MEIRTRQTTIRTTAALFIVAIGLCCCRQPSPSPTVADYFPDREDTLLFIPTGIGVTNETDSIRIVQHSRLEHNELKYEMRILNAGYSLHLRANANQFSVTRDGWAHYRTVTEPGYQRTTRELITPPSYFNVVAISEVENTDWVLWWPTQQYRVYFSVYGDTLVLHREYEQKGIWNIRLGFTQKNGLRTITFPNASMVQTWKCLPNAKK